MLERPTSRYVLAPSPPWLQPGLAVTAVHRELNRALREVVLPYLGGGIFLKYHGNRVQGRRDFSWWRQWEKAILSLVKKVRRGMPGGPARYPRTPRGAGRLPRRSRHSAGA